MNLLFVRHGKAEQPSREKWPNDSVRPLTDAGADRFRRSVPRILELMGECDAVYTSGYARASRTALLLCEESRWPAPIEAPRLEGDRSVGDLLELAAELDPGGSYAFVGHDPTISLVLSELIGAPPGTLGLKPGGVALIRTTGAVGSTGGATLIGLLQPRVLAPKHPK